ncbi:MAG: diaminopimelate epimerase [Holophagales bacterium]|nr:diaminopimelate epimerase [Holophagales bacterium]
MSGREFFKVSGGGNDFILLPPPSKAPSTEQIRAWCRRAVSIGADGVISLEAGEGSEPGGEARMVYWNADGGRSELCLNGSRCAARLAFELGWGRGDELLLHTDAGSLHATLRGPATVALELPPALVEVAEERRLEAEGTSYQCWYLGVGVPHLVLFCNELASVPMDQLGPALRHHPELGPAGANINFVRTSSDEGTSDEFAIRTWERGVEAETLACGTGVVAAGVVGRSTGRLRWPARALTAGGFELSLERSSNGGLLLVGDARLVARGRLLPEAEHLAEPPPWSPAG